MFFFVEAFFALCPFLRMLAVLYDLRQVLSYNQNSLTEQTKLCIYRASMGHLQSQFYYGDYSVTWDSFKQADAFPSKWKAEAFLGNADNPVKAVTLLKPTLL